MAEVNLRSWPEISQASEDLQLNSIAATLEYILAWHARLETRLIEHERRAAATLPPLRPEPDGPPLYTAAQPPYPPYQPPYQPDRYPPHNRPWATTALGPQPYPTLDSLTLHRNPWSMPHVVDVSTNSAPPTPPVPMPESYHRYLSPAAAAVRQPPQLRDPSSWFNMPQHQVLNSTPTYIASAISPTATTQSRSCHGQHFAVMQPLLSPPNHCCSAATLPAAAPPPPLSRYTITGKPYGDQLPVNGSPEINAADSQSNVANSDGNQIGPTISNEGYSDLPCENGGKVHTVQTWTDLAARKPLQSIDETRPGKGAPEEDSEEEIYDVEKDPAKDLQEHVVWLKVEHCMLIEEKRSAELRAEELDIALMEMVKQDSRRQLSAKVEQMQRELYGLRSAIVEKHEQENTMTRIQHGPPSVIFYGNNEGSRSTIRCAFDPGGDSSPKFLFATLVGVSWFPP